MAYATTSDLVALRSDITADVADWSAQLALAESDVLERIKTEWFPNAARSNYGYGLDLNDWQVIQNAFNATYLNTALLKNLTCYRALAAYIYPSLTRDTDDGQDAFSRRAERYASFYAEEWQKVSKMPLYDFDHDSTFEALERVEPLRVVRIYRA